MLLLASNFMQALNMMWQGMLGIFVVIGIIAVCVYLLTRFTSKKKSSKKEKTEAEDNNA